MEWFKKLTTNQTWAAYKHYITFAAGILGGVGIMSTSTVQELSTQLNALMDGLEKTIGALVAIGTLAAPVINGWKAAHNASPKEQIKSVVTNLSAPEVTQVANAVEDPMGREKLIIAVSNMPEVKGIVAPGISASTDPMSPKVVTSKEEIKHA